ncbi:cold-shock protein [Nocardia vaccinii]|uniref:cold-shock protein n=1 Tax=Nocardia vaccinii TaxID=1822 RepID=UPI000A05D4DB
MPATGVSGVCHSASGALASTEQKPAHWPDPHTLSTTWRQGLVSWFDAEKGFGFLNSSDGGDPVFVDFQVIDAPGYKTLVGGQSVAFTAVDTKRGPEATEVRTSPDVTAIGPAGRIDSRCSLC